MNFAEWVSLSHAYFSWEIITLWHSANCEFTAMINHNSTIRSITLTLMSTSRVSYNEKQSSQSNSFFTTARCKKEFRWVYELLSKIVALLYFLAVCADRIIIIRRLSSRQRHGTSKEKLCFEKRHFVTVKNKQRKRFKSLGPTSSSRLWLRCLAVVAYCRICLERLTRSPP